MSPCSLPPALLSCCFVLSRSVDGEEVVYERLPSDIAERYVLLLDPVLGTGRTAARAIQV